MTVCIYLIYLRIKLFREVVMVPVMRDLLSVGRPCEETIIKKELFCNLVVSMCYITFMFFIVLYFVLLKRRVSRI